jgi:hypothetical protein
MEQYSHRKKKIIVFRYLNYTNDNLCQFFPVSGQQTQQSAFHKEEENTIQYRISFTFSKALRLHSQQTEWEVSAKKEKLFISSHVDAHPLCRRRLRLGARARAQFGPASGSQPVFVLPAYGGFKA